MEREILRPLPGFKMNRLKEQAARLADCLDAEALEWLAARGVNADTARGCGLGRVNSDDPDFAHYAGHIAIPYRTVDGDTVGLRFRNVWGSENGPKYNQPAGSATVPYGLEALNMPGKTVSLCEGEFDSIVLRQLGLPALGIPGANAWKAHYRYLLDGFERVVVWGDPDEAGRAFNDTVCKAISGASAAVLPMDVSDTFVEHGMGAILDAFQRAGGVL